jgi:hypothetical protein
MELVAGGTLQQRVRAQGPFAVAAAVDAVLQVIGGLEAAQALGILHRDVKPSNCFEDLDGTVKVGDYGLSVSTLRTDTNVTVQGTLLGTPSFSSPEQLRGQELNARSDIYSVGVTLYYLLTGRTPFEGRSVVQLIANVLEQAAPSPRQFRPDLPQELARIVLRCLEKQPGERFHSYAELRQALGPFSSATPVPAPLALRFLAGAVDMLTVGVMGMTVCLLVFGEPLPFVAAAPVRTARMLGLVVTSFVLVVLYYSILEGIWGASLGKALCRLRVVRSAQNPPGIPTALARTLIFQVIPVLPYWCSAGFDPTYLLSNASGVMQYLIGSLYYLLVCVFFCTARRKNGYAAVHDLLTRTRVVRRLAYQARPILLASPEPAPTLALTAQAAIGPYQVLETLETTAEGQWLVGFDTRLLRKVWIHRVPPGTPQLPPTLRQLGRAGRLRWIGGRRNAQENWDAFESVSGQPFLRLATKPLPWAQVRFWLLDLARELQLAENDGTLPTALALDRVWITADGRAKLLDFPAPGLSHSGASSVSAGAEALAAAAIVPPQLHGGHATARFVAEVARVALEGHPPPKTSGGSPLAIPLPVPVREVLKRLPSLTDTAEILKSLEPLLHQMAIISRRRRFGLVAGCAALPLLACFGLLFGTQVVQRSERRQPGVWELSQLLALHSSRNLPWGQRQAGPSDRSVAIYIASHYRALITDSNQWRTLYAFSMIKGPARASAERAVRDFPNPSAEDVADAVDAVQPFLNKVVTVNPTADPWFPVMAFGVSLIVYVAVPALLAALLFRGGLILRALRVAVVRADGKPASRWRLCWRGVVSWLPVLTWPVALFWLKPALGAPGAAILLIATVGGLALCSILVPNRSLQDRLAGTFLVPR